MPAHVRAPTSNCGQSIVLTCRNIHRSAYICPMFPYRLFGFFGIVMLFACGTVMNPRLSRPTVQYYLGDENTAVLTADSTVQANSWVLIAQQTGNRRFARLVKGSPSLFSLDSLFKDSAWVKVPYGSIWSGRLNRLERKAGHGKKDRIDRGRGYRACSYSQYTGYVRYL